MPTPAVGTIIAANYVGMARVLQASLAAHHPDATFSTLVVDGLPWHRALPGLGRVLLPEDLPLLRDDWPTMAAGYTVLELATAAKPALLAHLLGDGGTATYLDPDIKVYAPLGAALTAAADAGIALTPHCLRPVPRDGLETSERTIRLAGTFNLGFVSVGQRARPFLRWWHERLRHDAVVDVADGLFTDQRWVDWVPSLFEHTVLRDPGLNVAYWNAHERDVRRDGDGRLLAGPGPLRFFHFSGYDPDRPGDLSRYALPRPRVRLADHPVLTDVCADYRADLARHGHARARLAPYGLDRLRDGRLLSARVRRLVRLAAAAGEPGAVRLRPHEDPAGLSAWLAEPLRGPGGARLRRWDLAVWAERPDLQAAFPDLDAGSARPFLTWLRHDPWASAERRADGVPPAPVPDRAGPPAGASGTGWSVLAYADAELGVGEAGRRLARAVRQAGLPTEVVGVGDHLSRRQHPVREALRTTPSYAHTVTCANGDQLERVWHQAGVAEAGTPGARVGLWFWEVDVVPEAWRAAMDRLDQVWVTSALTRRALERLGGCPVELVRLPVLPRPATPWTRRQLGLPEDRTVLLCLYDFLSVLRRKNPLDVLTAYTRAVGPSDGAVLVLKSINGHHRPGDLAQVRAAAAGRPDVVVLDAYLGAGEVAGLVEHSDCVVSLHRAEGYGLNLADAMAVGTPVVATGWSGNLAFMDAASAFLVPCDEIAVGPGAAPYPETARWAQPDLDVAASLLRAVVDDPAAARARGLAGQRKVLAENSLEVVGARVRDLTSTLLRERAA